MHARRADGLSGMVSEWQDVFPAQKDQQKPYGQGGRDGTRAQDRSQVGTPCDATASPEGYASCPDRQEGGDPAACQTGQPGCLHGAAPCRSGGEQGDRRRALPVPASPPQVEPVGVAYRRAAACAGPGRPRQCAATRKRSPAKAGSPAPADRAGIPLAASKLSARAAAAGNSAILSGGVGVADSAPDRPGRRVTLAVQLAAPQSGIRYAAHLVAALNIAWDPATSSNRPFSWLPYRFPRSALH